MKANWSGASSRRYLLSAFTDEADVLAAVRDARARGLRVVDVYAPHPVHGLEAALGWRHSRLPWVCFWAAVVGAALKLWFEFWTMVVSWPVNVGGKPWNSLPAFVPVTFEVMVLSAGLTTAAAFLWRTKLRPGKKAVTPAPRVTDDEFVVIVEAADAGFDAAALRRLFAAHNALWQEERVEEAR
jgi:hypothetical protein